MPRTPAVYETNVKFRKYDEDFPMNIDMENYSPADGLTQTIREQFLEEAELGMMVEMDEAKARELYPGNRLRIAAQGALVRADDSFRIVHDATHGSGLTRRSSQGTSRECRLQGA